MVIQAINQNQQPKRGENVIDAIDFESEAPLRTLMNSGPIHPGTLIQALKFAILDKRMDQIQVLIKGRHLSRSTLSQALLAFQTPEKPSMLDNKKFSQFLIFTQELLKKQIERKSIGEQPITIMAN